MMLAIVHLGRIVEADNGQLDDHGNRIDKI